VRRIVVVGSSGSGKTTVASELAERLGVKHVELDALHHGPNWTEASADELREAVSREIDGADGWVVDGGYHGKLGDFVLERADTVVWLDLPLRTCLIRLWHRTLHRIRDDVELWNGNRETWRGAFWGRESLFWFTIRIHRSRRRRWPARFAGLPRLDVVRLRTPREVDAFLARQARG
jgi:adenylate kinase family enzyme